MRRPAETFRQLAVAVLLGVALLAPAVLAAPAYAEPTTPPRIPVTTPAVDPCNGVTLLLQPVCRARQAAGDTLASLGDFLPNPIGGLVGDLGEKAIRAFTQFVVDGAVWFLGRVADVATGSTKVAVTTDWFSTHYRDMAAVAAVFALTFLLLSCIGVAVHRDPRRLARSVTLLAVAGVGTGMVLVITTMLLTISDALSAYVAQHLTGDLKRSLSGAATGLASLTVTTGQPAVPLFATLLAALFAALAAVVIWLELLLRAVAIYATVLFFPIGLAGLVWEGSRRWARHLAEILVALIFSKFVIVAILSLAASGLAGGGEGYAGVLAGSAMLTVAAFSPFVLMRVIGVLEVAGAAAALEGVRSRATRTATSTGYLAVRTVRSTGAGGRLMIAGTGGTPGVAAAATASGGRPPIGGPRHAGGSTAHPPHGGGSTGRPPPAPPPPSGPAPPNGPKTPPPQPPAAADSPLARGA